jgi:hypothetical protein
MESTTDFEKLLFLYKTEGKNMSIESFCINNGINYRSFDKWYRNTHKNIVPVQIIDRLDFEESEVQTPSHDEEQDHTSTTETLVSLSLYCNNGVSVKRRHLTFTQLKELIVKLEGLC